VSVVGKWVKKEGKLHFTLIDPEKQKPDKAGELAALAESYGSDAVMVGGSTASGAATDETVKAIKAACKLPVILFPGNSEGVSPSADYLFFMMLVNSRNPKFLVGEQVKAAPQVKKSKLKVIPMGYVVVSTSAKPTAVERVGEVLSITEGDVDAAVAHALAAQYFGMSCVYLEAGAGAEKPVTDGMIKKVKAALDVPLIVGGGIRDGVTAKAKAVAGADAVVTGTVAEDDPQKLQEIIEAVKN